MYDAHGVATARCSGYCGHQRPGLVMHRILSTESTHNYVRQCEVPTLVAHNVWWQIVNVPGQAPLVVRERAAAATTASIFSTTDSASRTVLCHRGCLALLGTQAAKRGQIFWFGLHWVLFLSSIITFKVR